MLKVLLPGRLLIDPPAYLNPGTGVNYLKIVIISLNFVIKRLTGIVFLHCKIIAQPNDPKNTGFLLLPFFQLVIYFMNEG